MTDKMEPERKIEKLLRSFAKKRRADAVDSFKLHPATRRILQGEAARRAPKPKPKPNKGNLIWQLFGGMSPGMIYGAFLIVFIIMGAAMLLPALGKAKSKAQMTVSMNNLRQLGVAAHTFAGENGKRLPMSLEEIQNTAGSNTLMSAPPSGLPTVPS